MPATCLNQIARIASRCRRVPGEPVVGPQPGTGQVRRNIPTRRCAPSRTGREPPYPGWAACRDNFRLRHALAWRCGSRSLPKIIGETLRTLNAFPPDLVKRPDGGLYAARAAGRDSAQIARTDAEITDGHLSLKRQTGYLGSAPAASDLDSPWCKSKSGRNRPWGTTSPLIPETLRHE